MKTMKTCNGQIAALGAALILTLGTLGACKNPVLEPLPVVVNHTEGLDSGDLGLLGGGSGGGGGGGGGGGSSAGGGRLVSLGPAASPGTTYYIDAALGNDANDGLSPRTPWKSFKNPNSRRTSNPFSPGDHILLEANSVWNGTSVTEQNYGSLLTSDTVGMLFPGGSGSDRRHIVIDAYERLDATGDLVSYVVSRRPLINGNGTPAPSASNRWFPSGAITLLNQHHWMIRNIEVTNTFDNYIANPNHYYAAGVAKHLSGIMIMGYGDTRTNPDYRGQVVYGDANSYNVVVQNCYVHDVQSMHTNNGGGGGFNNSTTLGGGSPSPTFKVVGGIIVYGMPNTETGGTPSSQYFGYNGILLEGNIVKRVALEGLRNKSVPDGSGWANSNVVFRGNYLEAIAGDGIVIDGVQDGSGLNARQDYKNGLVESCVVKDACSAPNFLGANYAAVWAMTDKNTTLQYNEAYGTLYGYQDGEAWDIDNGCDKVIYQYNYSHHNAGGCILFMDGITNGVFRYNVSANDAGSSRYVVSVTPGASTTANSYTAWTGGQTLFHNNQTSVTNKVALVYNNTFYVGDGITCGLYGNNSSGANGRVGRFFNNVLIKAGAGTVYLSYGHSGGGTAGALTNTDTGFKNNLLWGYGTDPAVGDMSKFNNGTGTAVSAILGANGNRWANPRLWIQETSGPWLLRLQRDSALPDYAYANADEIRGFTSISRLLGRAALLAPADSTSPVIGRGMAIPVSSSSVDSAWNDSGITTDMYGVSISPPPIGAFAAAQYPF
ncbi:MAG: hypothetical protein LBG84_08165 [Treponema sp.]|jgi:hypothetical protein|nr:hypothetical protein [Treponema sp.]